VLVSDDPRCESAHKKRKLGPQLSINLFNDYHGSDWVLKKNSSKVQARPLDYVENAVIEDHDSCDEHAN
jgi:hypothetical protein